MNQKTDDRMDLRSAWLIFISCCAVSMVVAAMAALNTALPDIAIATGADSGQMTWIIDGYTLVMAALLLPAGAIGDRFGRRGVLIVGLILFAIASLLAIWVSGPTQLIATRCFAGLAAALIMPTTLSLITSGVPPTKRPFAISVWAAIAGAGAVVGLFGTGVLLEFFSWESIFIAFAGSATLMAALCLTIGTSKDRHPDPFDFPGSVTSIIAVAAIVLGLLEAPHRGWDDALVICGLILGVACAALFVFIELRRRHQLLDVRLFTNRAFSAGSLSVSLQFFASFAIFFLFLQRLQLVFGYSALQSAIGLIPMVTATVAFGLLGNWVAVRFHSLRFVLGGGILLAGIGMILLGTVDYHTYWGSIWLIALCATGIGLATAPSTTAIMSNTPLDNQGIGSAVNDTARELGAAIGIALAGSILAAGYTSRIRETADLARAQLTAAGQPQAVADEAAEHISRSLAEATEVVAQLPAQAAPLAQRISEGAQQAFIEPMNQACIVLGSVLVVGALVLLWITPRRVTEIDEEILDEIPGDTDDPDDADDADDAVARDPEEIGDRIN
ncbi:MFS transporter [Gordonia sp. ABSL1-1]|uniref:MFS transporter n=1 Tax=Gordonia sp. ABSL1-1 TaxID=3053923 RepID=UPI0025733AC1|nr:MFS transporter [Gordonia sp. ABSL1-1]MDL9938054.1 MFS transporter [Gordonia sp. ABSL1-1]